MRRTLVVWALGFGLAVFGGLGCKRHAVPAQPVVRTLPAVRTEPNFSVGPLPAVDEDQESSVSVRRRTRRAPVDTALPPAPVQQTGLTAEQRRQDAILWQQQQAASQRQQQELNGVVHRSAKVQQDQQNEPRIQEAPEAPLTPPGAPAGQRIQDNPNPPTPQPPAAPEQPASPDGNSNSDQANPAQSSSPQS